MRVLISFIGTGRKAANEGKQEYETAIYGLPDGSQRESSLITSVLYHHLKPDKLIVIGTAKSIWSELDKLVGEDLDKIPIYNKIFEETWGGSVSEETLKEWEEFLREKLGVEISLNLVPEDATEEIVAVLNRELPQGAKEVYLDITHAFRHFPLLAAFTLPVLKYIKGFENLTLIYGKLNKKPKVSPIIFLNLPDRLIKLLEAVSLTEHASNFELFGDILENSKIKELYLKVETNRRVGQSYINNLQKELQQKNYPSVVEEIGEEYLEGKVLEDLKAPSLPLRMAKRAVFFAERKQFLKAFTLVYEALINTQPPEGEECNENLYRERRNRLDQTLQGEDRKLFHTIRGLRNAMAHGCRPKNGELQRLLEDERELIELVKKGALLVEKLENQKGKS